MSENVATIQEPREHCDAYENKPEHETEHEIEAISTEGADNSTRGQIWQLHGTSAATKIFDDNHSRSNISEGSSNSNSNSNSSNTLASRVGSASFEKLLPSGTWRNYKNDINTDDACGGSSYGSNGSVSSTHISGSSKISNGSTSSGRRSCSKDSSSGTLRPPGSSQTLLPTSPSQRSIEKAIAQKFASLGISQRPTWRARMDRFVLHEVCRNLISLLRSTFLNDIVPFDKNIMFHKTVAWSIVFFTVIHIAGHYVNYYHLEMEQDQQQQQQQQLQESGEKVQRMSAQYMAFMTGPGFTGHMLVLILFLMVTSSVVREIRARLPTSISKIVLHPSKVVEVQIKKESYYSSRHGSIAASSVGGSTGDPYFRAKAGQYMFLNCPDISAFEWHPFTITSAPEEDYVSVHIRIVGDWTAAFARRLGCSFDDEQQFWIEELMSRSRDGALGSSLGNAIGAGSSPAGIGSSSGVSLDTIPLGAKSRSSGSKPMTLPRVLIDGPYGSPSEDAFNYEIAVLVGAGIGVTPFASVLKHIWYSVMQPTKIITLRKVYFFWVCRDRDAFEWFQDLLIALEEQNMSDFLEIRSYLTGELGAEEMNTVLMEARAAAAMAAARHLKQQIRKQKLESGQGDDDGNEVEEEEAEEEKEDKESNVSIETLSGFPRYLTRKQMGETEMRSQDCVRRLITVGLILTKSLESWHKRIQESMDK
ncbi:hypothetical protein BGX27_010735 [Mortierella sp. AM989]|nr:hypothetical protein BGX27_010735 [Mortierella sp. AM989]